MSIKHIGTSIYWSAENHKTVPVKERAKKKKNRLSLLFCLPSAFHQASKNFTPAPGCLPGEQWDSWLTRTWQASAKARSITFLAGTRLTTMFPPFKVPGDKQHMTPAKSLPWNDTALLTQGKDASRTLRSVNEQRTAHYNEMVLVKTFPSTWKAVGS